MLLAFPKLTDSKIRRRKPVWFLFFWGHDDSTDRFKVELIFWWRPDLMDPIYDRGRQIPAALAFQWSWAHKSVRHIFQNRKLWFKFRFRKNASEIARRLAGGDE